ncbi:hypothetical protein A2U01_0068762, partial [Trifolium medium]|nr:hypothetical protein [Trifolium medium]
CSVEKVEQEERGGIKDEVSSLTRDEGSSS